MRTVKAGDGDARHGRSSTYQNHQCRCDLCTEAMRLKQSEYRIRLQSSDIPEAVHGTVNGYTNYACRCAKCRAANAEGARLWRAEVRVLRDRVRELETLLAVARSDKDTANAIGTVGFR